MSYNSNRLKFYFLGLFIDLANNFIPSKPHQQLAESIPDTYALKILDLCSGTGFLTRLVAERCPDAEVTGIDISKESVVWGNRIIKRKNLVNAQLIEGNASKLEFADNTFDYVLCAFGFHELPTEIRTQALKEIRRTLKPTGQLLTFDLHKPGQGVLLDLYLQLFEPPYAKEVAIYPGLIKLAERENFRLESSYAQLKGYVQFLTFSNNK